mmetsp:Transcript_7683/g.22670  ORF Transcript_7683/g.22670 Transcript_7683/m.22670 type:complete len:258 (+) Transcript_7683:2172-2945(+)
MPRRRPLVGLPLRRRCSSGSHLRRWACGCGRETCLPRQRRGLACWRRRGGAAAPARPGRRASRRLRPRTQPAHRPRGRHRGQPRGRGRRCARPGHLARGWPVRSAPAPHRGGRPGGECRRQGARGGAHGAAPRPARQHLRGPGGAGHRPAHHVRRAALGARPVLLPCAGPRGGRLCGRRHRRGGLQGGGGGLGRHHVLYRLGRGEPRRRLLELAQLEVGLGHAAPWRARQGGVCACRGSGAGGHAQSHCQPTRCPRL